MGDISVEPSMEDILSSIKRIIAEEGETTPGRARRPGRAPASTAQADDDMPESHSAEVLELNDPMPPPAPAGSVRPETPAATPTTAAPNTAAADPVAEPILSQQTAAATRGSLDVLSRLMVKPEPANDGTLEGLVREMLRPMLREWIDTHLPDMVEAMVAKEIAKITGQPG